jgi:hypothetical protein
VHGVRVQFGHVRADVVNLSQTGALTLMNANMPLGTESPLRLELPAAPVRLTGRVVRCMPTDPSLPDRSSLRNSYALAIKFVQPSLEAQAILRQTCGVLMEIPKSPDAVAHAPRRMWRVRSLNLRPTAVSFVRRCPRCQSRTVSKVQRVRYSCAKCSHLFIGLRLGPIRIAL